MRIAVLGTGIVGRTLAGKLVALGHHVMMGSRDASNPAAVEWAATAGASGSAGRFSDAAAFGEIIINATAGGGSLAALDAAGRENLEGKVLIDVANPLDSSAGFPPTLSIHNTDSLAEAIQREFPSARVVKALNTMRAELMVDPGRLADGDHEVFMAGNDEGAKSAVSGLLREFGWRPEHIRDLGPLDTARGLEMWLPLWIRIYVLQGNRMFNIKLVSD
jgi:predicted dinucleotide-binding enzyme